MMRGILIMSVINIKEKITKDDYFKYSQIDTLESTDLYYSTGKEMPLVWSFKQYIPLNKNESLFIHCFFDSKNKGEKPTKRQLDICKNQPIYESQKQNHHYIFADGVYVERSIFNCKTNESIETINHLIEKLNAGQTEGFVKGVYTAFYMPKNMRGYTQKRPSKKTTTESLPHLNFRGMI